MKQRSSRLPWFATLSKPEPEGTVSAARNRLGMGSSSFLAPLRQPSEGGAEIEFARDRAPMVRLEQPPTKRHGGLFGLSGPVLAALEPVGIVAAMFCLPWLATAFLHVSHSVPVRSGPAVPVVALSGQGVSSAAPSRPVPDPSSVSVLPVRDAVSVRPAVPVAVIQPASQTVPDRPRQPRTVMDVLQGGLPSRDDLGLIGLD